MGTEYIVMAIILTVIAGLSTSIGGLIGLMDKFRNKLYLGGALSLSAGVMLYVSMVEIIPHAAHIIEHSKSEQIGRIVVGVSFVLGMVLMFLIDNITCRYSVRNRIQVEGNNKLIRLGKITAIAIGIHNIPEGIAVSAPIYYATGNKREAFKWAFLSGITEPVAGILGYICLRGILDRSDIVMGIILGIVSGIMVYISVIELLPNARRYAKSKVVNISFIIGIGIMAISLMFGGHTH